MKRDELTMPDSNSILQELAALRNEIDKCRAALSTLNLVTIGVAQRTGIGKQEMLIICKTASDLAIIKHTEQAEYIKEFIYHYAPTNKDSLK